MAKQTSKTRKISKALPAAPEVPVHETRAAENQAAAVEAIPTDARREDRGVIFTIDVNGSPEATRRFLRKTVTVLKIMSGPSLLNLFACSVSLNNHYLKVYAPYHAELQAARECLFNSLQRTYNEALAIKGMSDYAVSLTVTSEITHEDVVLAEVERQYEDTERENASDPLSNLLSLIAEASKHGRVRIARIDPNSL